MLILLLSWLHLGWLSLAFGFLGEALLARAARGGRPAYRVRDLGIDRLLILGFLLITVLLALVSTVHAIDLWVNAGFVLLGGALTYRYRADFRQLPRVIRARWRRLSRPGRVMIGVALLAAIVGCLGAVISQVDAWFYHVPTIMWIKQYAVVPGLGNLHGRLAFNSHYFLSAALFSVEVSEHRFLLPVFSFFYALMLMRLTLNLDQAIGERAVFPFILNGLVFLLFMAQTFSYMSGVSTDYIIVFLAIHVFLLLLGKKAAASRELRFYWIVVALLGALTFKLSSMFLMAILPFMLFPLHRRKLVFLASTGALFLLPFLYRNYILSGYLVYPVAAVDLFDPDWKVPRELAVLERDYIEAYAKIPESKLFGGAKNEVRMVEYYKGVADQWLRIWWNDRLKIWWKPLLFINLGSVLLLLLALWRRERAMALVLFATLAYLGFWFLNAPDPRFAAGVILLNAALVVAYLARQILPRRWVPFRTWVFYPLALATLAVVFLHPKYAFKPLQWPLSSFVVPLPLEYPEMEAVEGLNFTYYKPPVNSLMCFNYPEPCTPYPKAGIRMRGERLQDGFSIDPAVGPTLPYREPVPGPPSNAGQENTD